MIFITELVLHLQMFYKAHNAQEAERKFKSSVSQIYSARYYIKKVDIRNVYESLNRPGYYKVKAHVTVVAKDGQSNPDYTGENDLLLEYDPEQKTSPELFAIMGWLDEYWWILLIFVGLIIIGLVIM